MECSEVYVAILRPAQIQGPTYGEVICKPGVEQLGQRSAGQQGTTGQEEDGTQERLVWHEAIMMVFLREQSAVENKGGAE